MAEQTGERRKITPGEEFSLLHKFAKGYKGHGRVMDVQGIAIDVGYAVPDPSWLEEEFDTECEINEQLLLGNGKIDFHHTPVAWLKSEERRQGRLQYSLEPFPVVMPAGFSPGLKDWVMEFDFHLNISRQAKLKSLTDRFTLMISYLVQTEGGEVKSVFMGRGNPARLDHGSEFRMITFFPYSMIYPETADPAGKLFLPNHLWALMEKATGRLVVSE